MKIKTKDLSSVFDQLEQDRAAGKLHEKIVTSSEWFEASSEHPGHVVKVSIDGKRTLGKFENGEFKLISILPNKPLKDS